MSVLLCVSRSLDFLLYYVIPISGQAVGFFLQVLRFAPPPSSHLQNENVIPDSVMAELALRTHVVVTVLM